MEVSNITKKRIVEYLSVGKRFDNRKLLEYRDIEIETGISKNAEGSARVRIGKTEVVAGVKMDVGEPYTDSEDKGTMMVTTELSPLASEKFEMGPPRINAIELARIIDRGIRESGFINFEKLCIKEGEKVWTVFIDIYPMNDDGNLIDASGMAAIAALSTAVMPKYDEKNEKVEFGEFTNKKLPLTEHMPLTLTFHKVGKNILLDPITEEEEAAETRVSLAISPKGKDALINAVQKGDEAAFQEGEIFDLIDTAMQEWKKLYPAIVEKIGKKAEK
jgi:exosome complex component RRP42